MNGATETLTIVLKGDGSGLTGTLRTSSGEVQRFGAVLDASSGKVAGAGKAARAAAGDIDALGDATDRQSASTRAWAATLNTVRGTLASLGITMLVRETLQAGLTMDRLERSTAAALGSQALAARELAFVREQAQRLGIYFPVLAEGYAGLAAATRGTNLQGEKTRQIFLGVAEAGRAMSLSNSNMTGVLQAVQQIAGKGVVSMEELRQQLGDRLPGAMQIAARAMNMTVAELVKMVSEGKLLSEDFLPRFADEMRRSAAAGVELAKSSPAAMFDRLKTALFDLAAGVSRDGGVLGVLASGASALTSALNLLMSSGALPYITKGLLAAAAAGAVFYVGGLLQRGFIALATSIALTSAPVTAFNAGLVAASVGAQGLTLRMVAASAATRGLAAAMAFVNANPIALAVTAVAALGYAIWKVVDASRQAAAESREMQQNTLAAKRAFDEFNKAPSLAAATMLADAAKQGSDLARKLDELRQKKADLDRVMGIKPPGWVIYQKLVGDTTKEIQAHEAALRALGPSISKAVENETNLLQGLLGVKNVSNTTRGELAALSQAIIRGDDVSGYAATTLARLAQEEGNVERASWLMANGLDAGKQSMSDMAEFAEAAQKRMANMRIQMAGIRAGVAGEANQRLAEFLSQKGGPQAFLPGQVAEMYKLTQTEIALATALKEAQDGQAAARKAAAAATRDQAKAQRDKLRDDNAEFRATEALNALIRDQSSLYGGPVGKELSDYKDQLAKIAQQERALEQAHRLDAEAIKLVADARKNVEAAHVRGAELARREQAEIERNLDLAGHAAKVYADETSAMIGTARERAVQKALIDEEANALEQYVKLKRENIDLTLQEKAAIRARIEQEFDARKLALDNQQYAEDVRDAWVNAADTGARAFGDWFARGGRDAKSFAATVKDTFKRLMSDLMTLLLQNSLVRPFQNWITQIMGSTGSAGFASGQGGGGALGGLGAIMNGGFDRLLSGITSIFSRGGPAAQAMQTATEAGWQMAKAAGVAIVPAGQVGGMMLPGGQVLGASGAGGFAGLLGPLLGVGLGAGLGGDLLGKLGGGLTGGALAYSMLMSGGGLAGLSAGMASGGLFGGLSGMAGAMGPIGWAALGAMALNSITGGKLFGTSYKTESASQQWGISTAGASGSQSITSVKQQSFFRGRKWKTTTSALDAEAMAAVNELFATLGQTVKTAAQQLGIDVPNIVGGTFKREFDKKGNLTREFGTIAGKVYNEAQDAFAARLVGENMLAVAKAAGSAAELEQLANAYRATGEQLQAFATLALAVQEDLRSADGIWKLADGDGVMTRIVNYVKGIANAGESLADAYTRVQQTVQQYGDLIGGVRQQIATHGLTQYQMAQLDVELAYRSQVKQANELAKALGLSGARAEDLAAIEQLRAISMADLAKQYAQQNQQWLQDLGVSDLSPLTDSQKLAESMQMLQDAVASGDMSRAQKLAEQALGLGRNLYASGSDYNDLYGQVTGLVGGLTAGSMDGLTSEQLAHLADLVSDLPASIAQELAALLVAPPPPATATAPLPPPPTPSMPPPSTGGTTGGGSVDTPSCVAVMMRMADGTLAGETQAGDVHPCMDPAEGPTEQPARWVGAAVLRPCVRLVTRSGAALVCSTTTPFTAPDAPADLPEYTTLAPDMRGCDVIVRRGGTLFVEPVVRVQDVGQQWVVPIDFGGRSFPAGEDVAALIYSHNMQKAPSTGAALAAIAENTAAAALAAEETLRLTKGMALKANA